ncbi:hypothetical protein ACFPM0_23625 [Pseudonocardia sulfidoxydans]|uniref:hypothetical protein n=1 Tax=Pseudonocardia sulfidoxydans TaxID=54011 RepID=UPI003615E504
MPPTTTDGFRRRGPRSRERPTRERPQARARNEWTSCSQIDDLTSRQAPTESELPAGHLPCPVRDRGNPFVPKRVPATASEQVAGVSSHDRARGPSCSDEQPTVRTG